MNSVNEHRRRDPSELVTLSVEDAVSLGGRVLAHVGYSSEQSRAIVMHMIEGVWSGYPHTGLGRILAIMDAPRTLDKRSVPKVLRETSNSATLDGGNTVGYLVALEAMKLAVAKAKAHGISVVSFINTYFTGRNSFYLERIADEGLVGFHAASTPPWVAPFGGMRPALGVNPIGFGFPCRPHALICDFGTASFMWGEIVLHERMGRDLPPGVAIDEDGVDTTDPSRALRGAILPFGGHKGYTLNLAVQMLCMLGFQDVFARPQDEFGFIFVAIDPARFASPDVFEANAERLTQWVASIPPRPGQEVRLPSARSATLRAENASSGKVTVEIKVFEELNRRASG